MTVGRYLSVALKKSSDYLLDCSSTFIVVGDRASTSQTSQTGLSVQDSDLKCVCVVCSVCSV
jgi:hypothetical protein